MNQDVTDKIKNSDKKEFEALFGKYYGVLCTLAFRYLKDRDVAEDVVSQVFLRLWEQHDQIDFHASVKNYLIRSVHNQCLNEIRHGKVIEAYSHSVEFSVSAAHDEHTPHAFAQETELEHIIQKTVDQLPSQCRQVYKLSREEQFSYQEIADQLNISVNTVKTQLSRGLGRLRIALKDYVVFF